MVHKNKLIDETEKLKVYEDSNRIETVSKTGPTEVPDEPQSDTPTPPANNEEEKAK